MWEAQVVNSLILKSNCLFVLCGFCSMLRLGLLLPPSERDACPFQFYISFLSGSSPIRTHLYTWVQESDCENKVSAIQKVWLRRKPEHFDTEIECIALRAITLLCLPQRDTRYNGICSLEPEFGWLICIVLCLSYEGIGLLVIALFLSARTGIYQVSNSVNFITAFL